jgi:HSP20 family protein
MASALTEWRPFSDFAELRHRLDQAFRDIADGPQHGWTPSVDVVKKEDELVLRADLPGIKPEDVKIEVEDGVLEVTVPPPSGAEGKQKIDVKSKSD